METAQDNVSVASNKPHRKDIDGLSNAAAVQIISGLTCIALQVRYRRVNTCGLRPSAPRSTDRILICPAGVFVRQLPRGRRGYPAQRKHDFHFSRWIFRFHCRNFRMPFSCFQKMVQVRLCTTYGESLAFRIFYNCSSFTISCLFNDSYAYLATSFAVVGSSVLYFLAGYWDFYAAIKESGKFYYITYNNDPEQLHPVLPSSDELHFWLRAGLFLCVIVLALFSLAGMAIVASYRFCNSWTKVSFICVLPPLLQHSGKSL